MILPVPSNEDTGSMIPEYSVAGRIVSTAVPKMAAIWLRMKVEISSPTAVAAETYNNVPVARVRKLPVSGTPKTVTASRTISRKLSIASAM